MEYAQATLSGRPLLC